MKPMGEINVAMVLPAVLAFQQANYRNVEATRSFDNLKLFEERVSREGSTKLNTMEIVEESQKRYEFRVKKCMFNEFFSYLEIPELTSIMCSDDNAIFNTYLPDK